MRRSPALPGGGGGLPRRGPCPAAGVQALSGPGWRGPRVGRGGARAAAARAVAERRQQVAPFPAGVARPLGRGANGGGVGARVCESVRAVAPPPPAPSSVPLARRGRAALSRVRAPSHSPPPPFCELESVTGARVAARPSGTNSSGWKETPQLERPKRRSAGTEDALPGAGPAETGAGWRARLSAEKWETFLNRGSPFPHGEGGGCLLPFFRKTYLPPAPLAFTC